MMKYIAIVQTKYGQKQIIVEAPEGELDGLLQGCLKFIKNILKP